MARRRRAADDPLDERGVSRQRQQALTHARAARGASHPRWTLVACILASSLAFIDGSVTNVALPAIGRELHASTAELQWTINAYMLPLSALILLGGAAGDHFGRKRLLIAGIALFTLASIGCALAPGLELLLAARAVQGVGAAVLLPNSLGLLNASFSGPERGAAVGTWAAVGAATTAVGPPVGGWLVDAVGWQAIFLINVPVAAAAIAIAARFARESAEGALPLDLIGAALATLALGALAWGLTIWSSRRDFDPPSAIAIGAGVVLLGLFVAHQHRLGDRAMMPLALFGSRAFAGLTGLTFLAYGALGGVLVLLPFVLINACGYSALQAGLALLPFPVVMGSVSRLTGALASRTGPRLPLTLGPLAVAASFLLMERIAPGQSYWTAVFPAMALLALGMSFTAAPLTTAVLGSVDDRYAGTASGFNSAIARTGGLIATAVAGAVIATAGAALVTAFHQAALVGAALSTASGAIGWLTLGGLAPERGQTS